LRAPEFGLDLSHALDPVAWAIDRLGFVPDPWQCDLMRSNVRQIAVCAGRQTGKTHATAAKAVHRAIYYPNSLVLCVAPAQRQSQLWFGAATTFIRKLDGAAELIELDNSLSCSLRNGSKLVALPADPSTIRGFSSAAMIFCDECAFIPPNDTDQLFSALTPMLAVSQGQLILISSANGQSGYFYSAFHKAGDDWQRFLITADMCPRISKEFLENERRNKLAWQFEQEYFCRWASPENGFIDFDTIRSAYDPSIKPLWSDTELASIAAGSRQ
jgi:hypothetical protein